MRKKILIADDDPAIIDSLTLMLQMSGYDVMSTSDGATLAALQNDLPHLILLDIWMSGENGKDICKTLKKQKTTKHIPVVLISASRDIHATVIEAGADGFISKPFEMQELLSCIEKHTA